MIQTGKYTGKSTRMQVSITNTGGLPAHEARQQFLPTDLSVLTEANLLQSLLQSSAMSAGGTRSADTGLYISRSLLPWKPDLLQKLPCGSGKMCTCFHHTSKQSSRFSLQFGCTCPHPSPAAGNTGRKLGSQAGSEADSFPCDWGGKSWPDHQEIWSAVHLYCLPFSAESAGSNQVAWQQTERCILLPPLPWQHLHTKSDAHEWTNGKKNGNRF